MINEHVTEWLGLPVELYDADKSLDYEGHIYRIATDWDATAGIVEQFERFTSNPECAATEGNHYRGISWRRSRARHSSEEVVQLLVAARKLLPNLRGIFIGDMLSEENEISWIIQSDVTPLFEAYPALEHFRVRGSEGLGIGDGICHPALKSLVFEAGGVPAHLIHDIAASEVPALEHLEIWTGSSKLSRRFDHRGPATLSPRLYGVAAAAQSRTAGLRIRGRSRRSVG